MICLQVDRAHDVLLVTFAGAMTAKSLALLDILLTNFVAREGTMPTVIDFTAVTAVDVGVATLVTRGQGRTLMPGQSRIFVTPDDLLFGLLRLYSTYQDHRGERPPTTVRSMAEAFKLLSLSEPKFEPVAMASPSSAPSLAASV
jgi:hypothetical protein